MQYYIYRTCTRVWGYCVAGVNVWPSDDCQALFASQMTCRRWYTTVHVRPSNDCEALLAKQMACGRWYTAVDV